MSTVCCSHNPSVAPSAVNAHSSGWKGNPPGLPQSTCVPVVQDACCVLQSGAEQSQGRGLWGCWDRREGSVANQGELSSLVLHLLSAFFCIQSAEAHCRVPVLARGGLQDACGLIQQRQN